MGIRKGKREQAEFNAKVMPRLKKLEAIGRYIASRVVSNPELLESDWKRTGERLLKMVFRAVGREPPGWIEEEPEVEAEAEDVEAVVEGNVRQALLEKLIAVTPNDLPVEKRIEAALDGQLGWT